uniref:Uncharacterized protein n=1 Tax=viral metagenome TaxID=1070528 RepID=A0A6C0F1I0_9ZZZZ
MNKTSLVLAFLVAAVLAGLFVRFNLFGAAQENFMQQPVGAPLNAGGIGPYDGVSIGGGVSGWASTEPTADLKGAAPLPSAAAKDNELMFLVDNKVNSDCCPSAFTTDTGCVCLSDEQKSLMASRGGNRA